MLMENRRGADKEFVSMTKAYGYLRVSGVSQLEGDGFDRQREAISTYAKDNDIKIIKWFEERGVSGRRDLTDRPAFSEMMFALHSNGATTVIIERLDRLARDLMIQETIIREFRKYHFTLISTLEPELCEDDPSRNLIRQMLGALAEYERTMIMMKLNGAKYRLKAKGQRTDGRMPFPDPNRPGELQTYTIMEEMRYRGMTYEHISNCLNVDRLATRSGAPWKRNTVRRILERGDKD